MLTRTKRSHLGYPIRLIYFPDDPAAMPPLKPWDVALGVQASDAVKTCVAPSVVKAVPYHTLITDLTQSTEALYDAIHPKKRNRVRQAERMPFIVRPNADDPDELYASFSRFYQNKNLTVPTRANFDLVYHTGEIFTIYYEGEPLIHHMALTDHPHRACLIYGWNVLEAMQPNAIRGAANIYLCWWELLHYQERGFHAFDWGGVVLDPNSPAYSRTTFKMEFGGQLRQEWYLIMLGALLRPLWRLGKKRFDTLQLEE